MQLARLLALSAIALAASACHEANPAFLLQTAPEQGSSVTSSGAKSTSAGHRETSGLEGDASGGAVTGAGSSEGVSSEMTDSGVSEVEGEGDSDGSSASTQASSSSDASSSEGTSGATQTEGSASTAESESTTTSTTGSSSELSSSDDGAGGLCTQIFDPVGGSCPGECNRCDFATGTCFVECDSQNDCAGFHIACPHGWHCQIDCMGASVCAGARFDCAPTYQCNMNCAGDSSCFDAQLHCSDGPCRAHCGQGAQICSGMRLFCGWKYSVATCETSDPGPQLVPRNDGPCACETEGCAAPRVGDARD